MTISEGCHRSRSGSGQVISASNAKSAATHLMPSPLGPGHAEGKENEMTSLANPGTAGTPSHVSTLFDTD